MLPNFDFDLKFEITGFSLTTIENGKEITEPSIGPAFSKNQIEAIKNAKAGTRIHFEKIKAKGPDGTERNLGSLTILLK
jgi:hypothetical protein